MPQREVRAQALRCEAEYRVLRLPYRVRPQHYPSQRLQVTGTRGDRGTGWHGGWPHGWQVVTGHRVDAVGDAAGGTVRDPGGHGR